MQIFTHVNSTSVRTGRTVILCQRLIRYIENNHYFCKKTMAMGYSGLAFADYFIEKALAEGKTITNMSVLKMIYFVQGFGYQILHRRLIKDDFYAWQWGPVAKDVYYAFQKYGASPIQAISNLKNDELAELKTNPQIVEILDKIYTLRGVNPFVLSEQTHAPGGPWSETDPYQKIEFDLIRKYYSD